MKLLLAAALVILAGCEKSAPDIGGIGKYVFHKTTAGDVREGVCQPTEIQNGTRKATWCYGLPSYTMANRPADINLYFDGTEPSAPLIEIQATITGCVEADLDAFLRKTFGPPVEMRSAKVFWQNSIMFVAAVMPSEPGRCRLHLLPLSEQSEIARLRAVKTP